MIPILAKAASLLTGGGGKLVESVGGVLDNLITSKEEKEAAKLAIEQEINRHTEAIQSELNKEAEIYLKDVQGARDANVQIQTSEKASWLAKNIAYCIDIFVMSVWGATTIYLLCVMLSLVKKDTAVDYTAVTAVWGGIGVYAGTVLNFHRGTSRSSEEKQKQINEMINK